MVSSLKEHKEVLKQDSRAHRQALEQELAVLLKQGKKVATTALVIGGGVVLTYYVIKKLSGKKKVKYKTSTPEGHSKEVKITKKSSVASKIRNLILTEAAVFMLAMAKEKLTAYLQEHNSRKHAHSKDA